MRALDDLDDREIVTLTAWAEARGESADGIAAVVWVIRNRAAQPKWWGRDLRTVCLKHWQFSCWNLPNEPQSQRTAMLALPADDKRLTEIRAIVDSVLDDSTPDPTGGATYYVNPAVSHPAWANTFTKLAEIGRHVFYAEA